ncbi:TSUP family transporter [Motiliproteus sediminis]|uniref:TSUP family transporter n=1 Tax=Motiliproteus sediminis TaxID=1468178 RepID=UPI001AEFF021|nr:TSUP family transporter [Motiliproteus sediminis]
MLLDLHAIAPLLLLVAFAAYVQTIAGFAYGLILMGVIGWLKLIPLADAAILVSLTSLVNVLVALRGDWAGINRGTLAAILLGLIPGLLGGIWLLDYLSSETEQTLRLLLGVTLLGGGFLLMLKPTPYRQPSPTWTLGFFGLLGGLGGGLFSVSGPPVVFHLYRQPQPLAVLKATLLAVFGFSTLLRILVVSAQGQMDAQLLLLGALAAPVVSLATLAGRRYPPPLSETNLKRGAFLLVTLMGITLLL